MFSDKITTLDLNQQVSIEGNSAISHPPPRGLGYFQLSQLGDKGATNHQWVEARRLLSTLQFTTKNQPVPRVNRAKAEKPRANIRHRPKQFLFTKPKKYKNEPKLAMLFFYTYFGFFYVKRCQGWRRILEAIFLKHTSS